MTPLALPHTVARAGSRALHGRGRLAKKLAVAFLAVVAFVLVVNGAINTSLTYHQARRAALEVEVEKARSAAERVGAFLSEIETQLGWTTGAEWGRTRLDQQRYDFIRLLREAPAVTALAYLDGQGKEQIAISRLEPDSIASGKDFSDDPRFVRAVADKVWFGPVEFRRGSEPYMTISMAHAGRNSGVTVADVNLKLIWDVVTSIHVGDKGFAYVVDDHGRLIAHPDLSLVLRDSDFSKLPQVEEALKAQAGGGAMPRSGMAEVANSLDGASVLTAYAIAPKTRWIVFVEQPIGEALAEAYGALWRMAALLAFGLVIALIVGSLLARRLVEPIDELSAGAERIGAGDMSHRLNVKTGDELERLADQFNKMADRIREGYETLEAKVAERTRDLEDSLAQQTATADVLKVISRSAFDLDAILSTLVTSAIRLCHADGGQIFKRHDDGSYRYAASEMIASAEYLAHERNAVIAPGRGTLVGRVALAKATVQIVDAWADEDYAEKAEVQAGGVRSMLGVPLLRDGEPIGAFALARQEPVPFTQSQVDLVTTFADQAVIAIENARLFEEVQAKTRDLEEALAQQTATADVLKVISRSAFDLDAILNTLLSSAMSLCRAETGEIFRRDDDGNFRYAASSMHLSREYIEHERTTVIAPGRGTLVGRIALEKAPVRILDSWADPEYAEKTEARMGGVRGMLGVPLLRDGEPIGAFALARSEPFLFTQNQVDLVTTFADQAVIAIENARLFEEVQAKTKSLETALERQTATSKILEVIASSPADATPVFDAIAASANAVTRGHSTTVFRFIGDNAHLMALTSTSPEGDAVLRASFPQPLSEFSAYRLTRSGEVMQIPDTEAQDDLRIRDIARARGYRSMVFALLVQQGRPAGAISVTRQEPGAFSAEDLAQLRAFADQAVIAIENQRLFEEVQARTRDLEESLSQQTATADVLKIISRSAFDLDAVFSTLLERAAGLCGANRGTIFLRDGEKLTPAALHGMPDGTREALIANPLQIDESSAGGRAVLTRDIAIIPDVALDPAYRRLDLASVGQYRSIIGVPLMQDGEAIGAFSLPRAEPGLYTPRQLETLKTFADQAVIAIENARLFNEVQAKTRELQQSLNDLGKAQDRLVQSEKLASLGQLTAGIAHEIKNPLNFVNNFAALSRELLGELKEIMGGAPLSDKDRDEVDDLVGTLDSNLDKVAHHGKRADSIVKNMLLHSREGSGERSSVNVNAMVEEALNLGYHGARAEKPGFNVTLEKHFDDGAGSADVHLQEITRVLLNLISNGFYATVKRRANGEADYEPALSASTRDLGARVEIRIRDNGTGIPAEVRAKMFNPFFTTKPAGEGTGLGLSLSHDIIVKQHGGTIEVETELGQFTEFVITLPRHFADVAAKGVEA